MNQLVTPVGKLFYMLWKMSRQNVISLDTKNKIKDMTIQNDIRVIDLLNCLKDTTSEVIVGQMILSFFDDQIIKFNSLLIADGDMSEESQSIISVRTMPRFNSCKPRQIEIKRSNFHLISNSPKKSSQTPKVIPTTNLERVPVGLKAGLENFTRRSTTNKTCD